jgi:hypothetical protein
MTPLATAVTIRAALFAAVALGGGGFGSSEAEAVSLKVRVACASDYFAHCSEHSPNSPGVRQCMRTNGLKLSKRCVDALVGAGEVSRDEVARRAAMAAR